eukprot:s1710_g1.t1
MMLSAIPKTIREEIIAHGQVSSLDVLCKLYSVYQPGNLQEKKLVLKMLEQAEECGTALQAVAGLRKWSLWAPGGIIGMAEPDASVLLRGLDKIDHGTGYQRERGAQIKVMKVLQKVQQLEVLKPIV